MTTTQQDTSKPTTASFTNALESVKLTYGPVIDGQVQAADSPETTKISPINAQELYASFESSKAQVEHAIASAKKAFHGGTWSQLSAADRGAALIKLADLVEKHNEELALLETLDTGKAINETRTIDIPGTAETLRWYGQLADKLMDEIPATPAGSMALVRREALGVVAVIVPWNFPLLIAAWKIAPALAAGNSVVVKPSEQSPLSLIRLAELAAKAGIPAGVFNVVPGTGSQVGNILARHNNVDVLTFTGSTNTAKKLMVAAGESNLKRLALEAGGKSSNIIFADTPDLNQAAEMAAFGAFYNSGQVCSANSKIFVEQSCFDEFCQLFSEAAKAYAPGDPLDAATVNGSLVSLEHADNVHGVIESSDQNATRLFGGERMNLQGSSAYIEPTAYIDVAADHFLQQHEVFGPVASLRPFSTEQEVLEQANGTDFGLAASLWTADNARIMRMSQALVAGTVSVNTVDALGMTTPFGGFKQSGFGRDLSIHAMDNYTALKTTWIQYG